MVMLLDARGQLKDPNAMDIGYVGEEDWTWETDPAISKWESLGGVTIAIAVAEWVTSQPSARPERQGQRKKGQNFLCKRDEGAGERKG